MAQVVDALALLHAGNVVHFDLKLQNIFLEPHPDIPDATFWVPPTEHPPFNIVIGDFGESKMWLSDATMGGMLTARPRGTDFMKSPEMLCNGHHVLNRGRENFDRRKHSGAGTPSDMWSLGCLLYHLVFGEMLFFDPDYMRFLQRIAFGGGGIIPAAAAASLVATPVVSRILDQLIMHEPDKRQTVEKVQGKLAHLSMACRLDGAPVSLPPHRLPAPSTLAAAAAAAAASAAVPAAVPPGATAQRDSAPLGEVRLPPAWSPVPDAVALAAAAAPPPGIAAPERLLHICPGVLFASGAVCTARALASNMPRCIVIVRAAASTGSPHQERWLRLAASLEVPAVFVNHFKLQHEASAAMLRQLVERVRTHNSVLVAYEEFAWAEGATVALSLAMALQSVAPAMAALRLKRCSALGPLPLASVAFAQAAVYQSSPSA